MLVRERMQISEPVHLYAASPKGLCASVYVCTVRVQKAFVRCEPIMALYSVLVLAHEGFESSAYVVVRARVQMSSCTRTCISVRYELTTSLCFYLGGCLDELLYGNLYVCTERPTKALCSVLLSSYRGTQNSCGTSTPACLMRKPAFERTKYINI